MIVNVPSSPREYCAFIEGANLFYQGKKRPHTFDYQGYFQMMGYAPAHPVGVGPEQYARADGWDFAYQMTRAGQMYEVRNATIH